MIDVHAVLDEPIPLGYQGEDRVRRVIFDISKWEEIFGTEYSPFLLHQRQGDPNPYPCNITREDGKVYWEITSADTAKVCQYGKLELRYQDTSGETVHILKSGIYKTAVSEALTAPETTAPEAGVDWIADLLDAAERAEEAAEAVAADSGAAEEAKDAAIAAKDAVTGYREASETAAVEAEASAQAAATSEEAASTAAETATTAATTANAAAEAATAAQEAIEGMSFAATTLAVGSNATVTKGTSGDSVLLTFGIPRGADATINGVNALTMQQGENVTLTQSGSTLTIAASGAIQTVKVNGTALAIADKAVNILIAAGATNGTIAVNGVDVAVTGLAALAYKAEVSMSDLASALQAVINAKAEASTVNTLIGTDTGKSTRTIANEELVAQLIPASAQESLDTLQEIAAWIQQHPSDAAALNAKLTLGTYESGGQQVQYATVKAYVEAVVSGLITLSALSASVSGNGNAITGVTYDSTTGQFQFAKGTTFQAQIPATGAANRGVYVSSAGTISQMAHTVDADVPSGFATGTATPSMDGTAAVGTSAKYAREDHVHPTDTSLVPKTTTINGKALSGNVTLDKADIGLSNVNNTSDMDKPISEATQEALDKRDTQIAQLQAENAVLQAIIGQMDPTVTKSASGNPVIIDDGYDGAALVSATVDSSLSGETLTLTRYGVTRGQETNPASQTVTVGTGGAVSTALTLTTLLGENVIYAYHGNDAVELTVTYRADTTYMRYDTYPTGTASGNPASFDDGAENIPVKSLSVAIEPVQNLHGYDAPWPGGGGQNLLPPGSAGVSTSNGVTFTSDGKGRYTIKGTPTSTPARSMRFTFPEITLPESEYIYIHLLNDVDANMSLNFFYKGQQITYVSLSSADRINRTSSLVGKSIDAVDFNIQTGDYARDITLSPMLLTSGEIADFVPYANVCPITGFSGTTISVMDAANPAIHGVDFGRTVYGGTLDVATGVLTVTRQDVILTGQSRFVSYGAVSEGAFMQFALRTEEIPTGFATATELSNNPVRMIFSHSPAGLSISELLNSGRFGMAEWGENGKVSVRFLIPSGVASTVAEMQAWLQSQYDAGTPVQIVYPLKTPLTYQLTPEEVTTLLGTNHISADCGNVEVLYRADTGIR